MWAQPHPWGPLRTAPACSACMATVEPWEPQSQLTPGWGAVCTSTSCFGGASAFVQEAGRGHPHTQTGSDPRHPRVASGYSPSTHCQVLGPATAGVAGCTPTVQGGSGCSTGNRLRTLWRPRHDCQQRAWGMEGGPWEKSAPTSHCLSWGQQSRDMGDAARGQCSGLPSWGSGEQTLGQCECPALARAAEHPGTSPGPRDSLRAP